jgi:hypothetical protein
MVFSILQFNWKNFRRHWEALKMAKSLRHGVLASAFGHT